MQEAVLARQEVHEGAEGLDRDDAAGVDLADLGDLDDELDALDGSLDALAGAAHVDGAVLLDVHGRAGLILDTADDLAARADDLADLVNRHADRDDAWRGGPGLSARAVDLGEHLVEDERAALLRLGEGAGEDLEGEARGLVVHLERRDAALGAADLEVHVAEEVLDALDVGEDDGLALLLDEAHGDAGDGALQRHAAVHEGQAAAAGARHGARAVGLHDVGDDAEGVGELVLIGEDREQGALGEVAVADLAALRGAHAAGLTGAVGREAVLVHVALALGGLDGVQALALVQHAEREHGEDLGLTALEEAGAVHERQVARLHHDRADLVGRAAVNALAGLDDHRAHGLLLEFLELDGDVALPLDELVLAKLGADGLLELGHLVLAGELVGVAQRGRHLIVVGEDALVHLL